MNPVATARIKTLPTWAQDYIADLEKALVTLNASNALLRAQIGEPGEVTEQAWSALSGYERRFDMFGPIKRNSSEVTQKALDLKRRKTDN